MPRLKPRVVTQSIKNSHFQGIFFPATNPAPLERGWHEYKQRVFKVVQKFAPMEPTYLFITNKKNN